MTLPPQLTRVRAVPALPPRVPPPPPPEPLAELGQALVILVGSLTLIIWFGRRFGQWLEPG